MCKQNPYKQAPPMTTASSSAPLFTTLLAPSIHYYMKFLNLTRRAKCWLNLLMVPLRRGLKSPQYSSPRSLLPSALCPACPSTAEGIQVDRLLHPLVLVFSNKLHLYPHASADELPLACIILPRVLRCCSRGFRQGNFKQLLKFPKHLLCKLILTRMSGSARTATSPC